MATKCVTRNGNAWLTTAFQRSGLNIYIVSTSTTIYMYIYIFIYLYLNVQEMHTNAYFSQVWMRLTFNLMREKAKAKWVCTNG